MAAEAEHAQGSFPVDPLHQFVVNKIVPLHIGGYDVSFTNSSFWMAFVALSVAGFTIMAMNKRSLVPGRMQAAAEMFYTFIYDMVRDNAGKEALRFFPFIFTLFMFIFAANVIGLFPYAFTVTSHIIITFIMAGTVFVGVTFAGFYLHGFKFLKIFVPSGVPLVLLPLVVLIEVISYISRPISHSVRLFANMLAGHITLEVFAGFVLTFGAMGTVGYLGAVLPLAMIVALMGLELLVAALQAYVFAILTCMYLSDAMHPGH